MEVRRHQNNTLAALLLISILLHLMLVIPFITIDFDILPESPLLEKLKEIHQEINPPMHEREEWAALAPHQGAPVIMVDTDEFSNQQITQTESQDDTTQGDNTPDQSVQAMLKDLPELEQADVQKTELVEQNKESDKLASVQKPLPSSPKKPEKTQTTNTTVKKPSLTLAKIAQGFAKHMEQEGDLSIAMAGRSNAKATESQLRVGRFLQKILACVQTSWRTQISKYPLSHPIKIDIHFNMVVNKDGTLNNIILTRSSGSPSLDVYVANIIRDASSSFPPIPDYLNWNICTIRCDWDDLPLPDTPIQFVVSH
ncbi:MAG TPA: TonB C-terminal domain-containing protein [Candidatus Dependentiae bacterium]|nr:TonB C-terminal domain-containing protein [Candidatus Dependentiae bacterium]HRQ62655.1 TonB C-terminal domain-containing protein [Candidatus Dependentiae bacterium]